MYERFEQLLFQSTQPKRAATVLDPATFKIGSLFQSTQPKRAATVMTTYIDPAVVISIHAAQEGCDVKAQSYLQFLSVFQSTQPKRAATLLPVHGVLTIIFQSTQPKRAAT